MEEQKRIKEATITLELTVEEFLFIQEKVHLTSTYNHGGYAWEREIEENVIRKLNTAYLKPSMTAEEYQRKLEEVEERWKETGCKGYMRAAEERNLRFHYHVEGMSDDTEYEDCEE